ncbi:Putative uncharacterized protein, partial [Taphrina deformans PYCC 5710]
TTALQRHCTAGKNDEWHPAQQRLKGEDFCNTDDDDDGCLLYITCVKTSPEGIDSLFDDTLSSPYRLHIDPMF